jgi:proteasome assembly chaperone (PAC2) family protein
MTETDEFEGEEQFDVDAVEVSGGLLRPIQRPRNRFFSWTDPSGRHDLIVFVGEAQPPAGKYAFCRRLIDFARGRGVERVFTFAAMATHMHPARASRVFGAATDRANLDELKRLELAVLEGGQIGGLNGVLLGAAAAAGLNGACLLGVMPHIFAQVPFPKASHAILDAFTTLAGVQLDLTELARAGRDVEQQLGEILARVDEQYGPAAPTETEGEEFADGEGADEAAPEPDVPPRRAPRHSAARKRIEGLFEAAAQDQSKAFELKQELDRLELFKEYEDRFLDLFKRSE